MRVSSREATGFVGSAIVQELITAGQEVLAALARTRRRAVMRPLRAAGPRVNSAT